MPTGDQRTNFAAKRNLPRTRLDDTFFQYLADRILAITSRVWSGQRGIFGSATLVSGGNDQVEIQTSPVTALDGDGNILSLTTANGFLGPYRFENANAVDYTVGARHTLIPREVVNNPRNNVINYDRWEDSIGESADPDSVTEAAGQLTVVVDSVFESGVSNAGRTATVFLKNPKSNVEGTAVERGVAVTWDGSNNKILTTGLLGQPSGSASTDAADYTVVAEGPSIRRNTNLAATDPYAFVGTVTGGGAGNPPSGFSTVGQVNVEGGLADSLQSAYVNGRTITPSPSEDGEVKIESTEVGGEYRSGLTIRRAGSDTNEEGSAALYTIQDADSGICLGCLMPVKDYSGTDLQEVEPGSKSGASTVDLTRGAVDATGNAPVHVADMALLEGFATGNGLYQITSVAAASVALIEVGNNVPSSWPTGETGSVRFLRPRLIGYANKGFSGTSVTGWEMHGGPDQDPPFHGSGNANDGVLHVFPWEQGASVVVYDGSGNPESRFAQDGLLDVNKVRLHRFRSPGFTAGDWDLEVVAGATAPEDQVVLRNRDVTDNVFGVESMTDRLRVYGSLQGETGTDRLGTNDEVFFGVPDATDADDDIGLEVSRIQAGDAFSTKVGYPQSVAGGYLEVRSGVDINSQIGAYLSKGIYHVASRQEWIWVDLNVFDLTPNAGSARFFNDWDGTGDPTQAIASRVFSNSGQNNCAFFATTADWPEGMTLDALEVDWEDSNGSGTRMTMGASRLIWNAGSARTAQSIRSGGNTITHPGGGRTVSTFSCDQNNTDWSHDVDKLLIAFDSNDSTNSVYVYGVRLQVTYTTVSKWSKET